MIQWRSYFTKWQKIDISKRYKFNYHSVEYLRNNYVNVPLKNWNSNVLNFYNRENTVLANRIENSNNRNDVPRWECIFYSQLINRASCPLRVKIVTTIFGGAIRASLQSLQSVFCTAWEIRSLSENIWQHCYTAYFESKLCISLNVMQYLILLLILPSISFLSVWTMFPIIGIQQFIAVLKNYLYFIN